MNIPILQMRLNFTSLGSLEGKLFPTWSEAEFLNIGLHFTINGLVINNGRLMIIIIIIIIIIHIYSVYLHSYCRQFVNVYERYFKTLSPGLCPRYACAVH